MSSKPDKLKIAPCSHRAARYAVMQWHYSQRMPVGKMVRFGVWENDKFIGCVIFSRGASGRLWKKYGLTQAQGCELTRVALDNHQTPVTRILKICIAELKKMNPGLELIVSFVDSNEGHLGKIYQAGNWIYTGRTPGCKAYLVEENGRQVKVHQRVVTKSGYVNHFGRRTKCHRRSDATVIWQHGKYRYFYPLTKSVRKSINKLSQPYPTECPAGETVSHSASS